MTQRCDDNSRCYPVTAQCDNIQDCADNSDERDCSETKCQMILTEPTGIISLPPDYYPGVICSWKIGTTENTDRSLIVLEVKPVR